jgi:hypothetical protein
MIIEPCPLSIGDIRDELEGIRELAAKTARPKC